MNSEYLLFYTLVSFQNTQEYFRVYGNLGMDMHSEKTFLESKERPKKASRGKFIELKSDYGLDLVKTIKTHFTQSCKEEKL